MIARERFAKARLLHAVSVLFITFAAHSAIAQTGASTGLRGTVTDPTGASIPGADVTIVQVETGEQRAVSTNETGVWEARFLSPGPYRLTFERDGFKKLTQAGVTVTTSEVGTVNVALELGDLVETVEVFAEAEMVSANSATIVRALDQRELEALPTSSRNFTQLLVIEPGVSADISELLSNNNASISPSVNGARTTNNSFSFNGIDVTNLLCCNSRINGSRGTIDEGGGTLSRNIAPAPETLAEVKLQTSLFDAATGRNGGGNFQLVSKSGTNELHGSVYHFFQNDKLIANDFFFNRAEIERPKLRRNEGGFAIGGPIVRNKTFFFGSYQFTRARTSFIDEASNTRRMPQALTDDRSDAGINQFARDIAVEDVSQINPISRMLLQGKFEDGTFLIPSGANGFNCGVQRGQKFSSCQILSVIPGTFKQDQFTTNIDHQLTSANKISGRFFFTDQPSADPLATSSALTRFERLEDTTQRTASITDVHIFGPTLINEFRAGFFRNRNDTRARAYFTNAEFGINNPLAFERPDLALIRVSSPRDVGEDFRFGTPDDQVLDVQNTFYYGDTLSLTKGQHSIKLGGEYRRNQLNGNLQETKNGEFRIDRSWFNFLTVGMKDSKGRARQIRDTSLNYGETVRGYRFSDSSFFVADDWKVTPSLTLNIGVRYEYFGSPWEVNGILSNFDFDRALAASDIFEGFTFASNFNPNNFAGFEGLNPRIAGTKSTLQADRNNFAPRFGFAWSPRERLVFRGGYGVFYERTTGSFANSLRQAVPFFREEQLNRQGDWNAFPKDSPVIPIPDFIVGFDDGEAIVATADDPTTEFETFEAQVIPANIATPYIQQWSFNVQWEMRPDLLLEVGYVGTKGTKLLQIANVNQPLDVEQVGFLPRPGPDVPGGGLTTNYFDIVDDVFVPAATPPCDVSFPDGDPGDCVINSEARLPLLGFDEDEGVNTAFSNANSIYNSLQVSLEKRFSQNYMFNVNYTFSKSIDTFSDEGQYQIEHDQTRAFLNRGLSDFDRRHRMVMSWVWDLPFKGNRLLEGWSISGIGTFQSGRPFSIVDDDFSSILFDSRNPRPNIAPGSTHEDLTTKGSVTSRIDNYLNPDAIESSGAPFGNLGRNTVSSPDQRRVDLSLSKLTKLSERTSLEFRAEFFNAFNTVTFRPPRRDLSSGGFGEITRTRGGPRVIQFGLKLRF